jgi:hypothetical protein
MSSMTQVASMTRDVAPSAARGDAGDTFWIAYA